MVRIWGGGGRADAAAATFVSRGEYANQVRIHGFKLYFSPLTGFEARSYTSLGLSLPQPRIAQLGKNEGKYVSTDDFKSPNAVKPDRSQKVH